MSEWINYSLLNPLANLIFGDDRRREAAGGAFFANIPILVSRAVRWNDDKP